MITQDFPLTAPKLAGASGYHPALIRHLMPKADHNSGTTPRWSKGHKLPDWRMALILPRHEKEPKIKPLCDVAPADIDVLAWLPTQETARQVLREYMQAYWTITKGHERTWIAERAKALGGGY